MTDIHVYTSAAANYLPKVRVLFATLEEHHPEWRRHLVLVEDESVTLEPSRAGAHSVLTMADLGIAHWRPWSFCHRLVELATAVKPFAMARLLARDDARAVIYLDPDTALFSPLDEVVAALEEASILLTPHLLQAETQLGRVMDNEVSCLRHGVYNLGFVAVAANSTGHAFAQWWSERLYRFCRDDVAQGLFTDQRWIDLVPALFPEVAVLRSPRLNVASWNLSQRQLTAEDGAFVVEGEPLGFYHFTSLSTGSHALMALKNSAGPAALQALTEWYGEKERALTVDSDAGPWSFGTYSDGTGIDDAHRRLFRDSPTLQQRFDDPYDARGFAAYVASHPELVPGESPPALPLSVGYSWGDPAFDGQKLQRLLGAMLTDPRLATVITRRLVSVLGKEGLAGVMRRLR